MSDVSLAGASDHSLCKVIDPLPGACGSDMDHWTNASVQFCKPAGLILTNRVQLYVDVSVL